MSEITDTDFKIQLLSELLLTPHAENDSAASTPLAIECLTPPTRQWIAGWSADAEEGELQQLESLSAANHVILRSFSRLAEVFDALGKKDAASWIDRAVGREKERIEHALVRLERICTELEVQGCPTIVIKSLDHWPDLGGDLDLYTDADAAKLKAFMVSRCDARVAQQSWGDRLANKWNFQVPGLPELVEVHAGRLGQMGEHVVLTRSLSDRSRGVTRNAHRFCVPAPEDQIILSTLQRMYRHFYIRLCDVADIGQLLRSGAVDFSRLHLVSSAAGIWEGVATYLTIVSQYLEAHSGWNVSLPSNILGAARFSAKNIRYYRSFLRVPILPHSFGLYARELKCFLLRGDFRNGMRLGLLPCLATAAAVEQKVTGSDKGIW